MRNPNDAPATPVATAPPGTRPKVLLALSGGVDSAVCARLLQQQGYAVEGLVIRFSPAHEGAVQAARIAAKELDIPLTVARCEEAFDRLVALPFCRQYAAGHTPNPCVVCNPLVKFATLAQKADEAGIHHIATGHYARLAQKDGLWHVACAASAQRDQSYMLYRLPQAILSRLLLPAGKMEKQTLRYMATGFGLSSADAPDSQEICFIPDGDYAAYITRRGVTGAQGHFWGPNGEDLGPHRGVIHYTVGQRRGLGLALGRPVFVKAILPGGDIHLAWDEDTGAAGVDIADICTPGGGPLPTTVPLAVKIRSMATPTPCRVSHSTAQTARILFATPQRAPAPGQHAVLYQNGLVVGGGVIQQPID